MNNYLNAMLAMFKKLPENNMRGEFFTLLRLFKNETLEIFLSQARTIGQAYETKKRVNQKSANATSPKSSVDKTCHNGVTVNTQKKPETNINTVEVPTMDEVTKFLSKELMKFQESIKATVMNDINPKFFVAVPVSKFERAQQQKIR
ncbi:hypothetical protein TSAR_006433 [Trichomalopsis sarcophagae]|uniref:Uncharacterized protein n=1 Tax=Trichomalopsis sarcophagae TaxID=543379 RepID=A0A232ENY8_9HYME|nr:hypothetical protein TSAR_006433 [Trichomalopsis sarcophagae]